MKSALCLFIGIAVLSFIGCSSSITEKTSQGGQKLTHHHHFSITPEERAELKCKKSCTLSDSLRRRMIANSKELELTSEEIAALKSTGKVTLCGKCGHIIGTKAYTKWKAEKGSTYNPQDDFVPHSLRNRILEISIN